MLNIDERIRGYIYRVLIAVGALVGVLGYLSGEQITAILGVLTAVLNVMPASNTSIKRDE